MSAVTASTKTTHSGGWRPRPAMSTTFLPFMARALVYTQQCIRVKYRRPNCSGGSVVLSLVSPAGGHISLVVQLRLLHTCLPFAGLAVLSRDQSTRVPFCSCRIQVLHSVNLVCVLVPPTTASRREKHVPFYTRGTGKRNGRAERLTRAHRHNEGGRDLSSQLLPAAGKSQATSPW